MGYRKVPTIYTLDFEGTEFEGLTVRVKAIRIGKIRQLISLVGREEEDLSQDQMGKMFGLLADSLVSWNLEDEHGNPVPADETGINDQEFPLVMRVMHTWLEGMTGVTDDLGKGSDSGVTSRVPLPTMEAL